VFSFIEIRRVRLLAMNLKMLLTLGSCFDLMEVILESNSLVSRVFALEFLADRGASMRAKDMSTSDDDNRFTALGFSKIYSEDNLLS
jgi:hypothetical protein